MTAHEQSIAREGMSCSERERERGADAPKDKTGRNVVQQVRHVCEQYYLGFGTIQVILCK